MTCEHGRIAMDWKPDTTGRMFTLTVGNCQALVMHASMGEWIALLSCNGKATKHQQFLRLLEAKQWCEAQIKETSRA